MDSTILAAEIVSLGCIVPGQMGWFFNKTWYCRVVPKLHANKSTLCCHTCIHWWHWPVPPPSNKVVGFSSSQLLLLSLIKYNQVTASGCSSPCDAPLPPFFSYASSGANLRKFSTKRAYVLFSWTSTIGCLYTLSDAKQTSQIMLIRAGVFLLCQLWNRKTTVWLPSKEICVLFSEHYLHQYGIIYW